VKTEIIKIIEKNKEHQGDGSAEATERDKALRGLLQYVCDYEKCELTSTDFEKRKRSKNNVPIHEQCIAKKADGSRCTRRKRDGSHFCGTHIKGTPHGFIEENATSVSEINGSSIKINNMVAPTNFANVNKTKKVEIWLEDINGIMHYIDNNFNVYDNEDIKKGINDPKVIYKYEKDYVNGAEIYTINSSNLIAS
jgi:hypothetical protein